MRPPDDWRRARVTLAIAAVTAAAWLLAALLGLDKAATVHGGFIPARICAEAAAGFLIPWPLTPLTAALVHAGLAHLLFNLLFLAFCGRSVEPIIGGRGLVLLYIVGAYAAAGAHWAAGRGDLSPMVGASGAISAIVGAYAILFGRNRVKIAHPGLALVANALWLAAAWVVLQLLVGLSYEGAGNRTAIFAHIGGFLAGLALARPLLLLRWRGA